MNRFTPDAFRIGLPAALLLLGLLLVAAGCAPETAETKKTAEPVARTDNPQKSSHERMREELEKVAARTKREHPYIGLGNSRALEMRLASLPPGAAVGQRLPLMFELGKEDLRLAREREAIEKFKWCLANVEQLGFPEPQFREIKGRVLFELGVAYLRLAETENCCQRNAPESCILPLRGDAIHQNREGSTEATKCFVGAMEISDPDGQRYWSSRWLLNIAYMTLGQYPESVPEPYLIPPSAFESQEPFPQFTNIAKKMGLDTFSMCGAAVVDDFDGDHYLDIVVSPWEPTGQIQLFRNGQDGTFTDNTEQTGLSGFPGGLNMVQADYDNDGDIDLYVLRGAWLKEFGQHPNSLLRNNGDGTFTDVTFDVGMTHRFPTQTAAWADYDNDGFLDLFVGNESSDRLSAACQLYHNRGDGTFEDVAQAAGVTNRRYAKGAVWGDYNGDRFPDLYVSNLNGPNRLYRNNGDGTFTDVADESGVERPLISFPAWFWDFNNDGALDLYVSSYSASGADIALAYAGKPPRAETSVLYRGDGNGGFEDVSQEFGLKRPDASMGANFGDLDNDGFLDFYLGTGYPNYSSVMPGVMYRNQSGKSFADITTAGGFGHLQKGHAVAFADLDNDGDQDVFEQMGGAYPGDRYFDALYENPGMGNHWITLKLTGTESNRSAIGARILVEIEEGGQVREIYRYVGSGGSFGASPLRQTIGLGSASSIRKLEVYWPTTDQTQTFDDVPLDTLLEIVEGSDDLKPIDVKQLKLGEPSSGEPSSGDSQE